MPYPKSGESKDVYISRFMESAEAKKDFPDDKQRVAVAYSMYEKRENSSLYTRPEDMPWPKSYKANFIEPGVVAYSDLGDCTVCGDKHICGNGGDQCQPEGATILVPIESLDRMAPTFVGKPVIDVEHKDVTPKTLTEGEADGIVTRVWKENGWWWCDFLAWTPETQKHCDSGLFSVSCAYEPTEVDDKEGEYHNIPYASTILNGDYTHLAIVQQPRYEGARILVNSKGKGGLMDWKFWTKGARKNAAPIDPEKEMVDLGNGSSASLKQLYDALPDEPKKEEPKYNDETMLSTPKGDKSLGDLKKNYLSKEEEKKNAEGEKVKPSAPADSGHGNHEESSTGSFQHGASCDHCRHPAFNDKEEGRSETLTKEPPADLRHAASSTEGDPEGAAKKLEKETEEKRALELQQEADDKSAKEAEEKKNADDKAKQESDEKEKQLQNAKKKSFADLRNARFDGSDLAKIMPAAPEERLARGKAKYGSA